MKNILLLSVIAIIAGLFFFGDDLTSVAGTAVHKTRESADLALGLDFKIDRAEHALSNVEGEIRQNQHQVAEIQVQTEDLVSNLASLESREKETRRELRELTDLYQRSGLGSHSVTFRGKEIEGSAIERQLQLHNEKLKNLRQQIASRKALVLQHEETLDESREILAQKASTKEQLSLQTETIRLELDAIEMSEALNGISGKSSLAQAQALIKEVDNEIRIRTIMVDDQKDPFEELIGSGKPIGEELLEISRAAAESR